MERERETYCNTRTAKPSAKKKRAGSLRPAETTSDRCRRDYGVWLVPMYAEAGVQVTPAGQTGTPPFGPMNAPGTELSATGAEQPLPSHAASKSTEKRPSANIETMTQFWLGRVTPGGKKPGRATEYVPATLLLFRLKYIQPPTSPEVENGGNSEVLGAEHATG